MKHSQKASVSLDEVYFDEELYPRSQYVWQVAYKYEQSMMAGSIFPPIVLAIFNNKKVLVDGKHRLEAHKMLKREKIDAIIYTGLDKKQIFELAIKLNNTHGRELSPYDRRRIALRLMEMNFAKLKISELINVPFDKLDNFVGERLFSSTTKKPITTTGFVNTAKEIGNSFFKSNKEKESGRAILKNSMKQFAGQNMDAEDFENIQLTQDNLGADTQLKLFKQVLNILSNKLLDKKDEKLMAIVKEIKKLLQKY